MSRILQTNLGRAKLAHDIACADAIKNNVDIVVISEPNRSICRKRGWVMDQGANVAFGVVNKRTQLGNIEVRTNYIRVTLPEAHVFMTYISPNIPIHEFRTRVDEILEDISRHETTYEIKEKNFEVPDLEGKETTLEEPATGPGG